MASSWLTSKHRVIVPAALGLRYLKRDFDAIIEDPTLRMTPFVIANQIGLCVTMWCRFLDTARKFRNEMGHATFGYGDKFPQPLSQKRAAYTHAGSSFGERRSNLTAVRRCRNAIEDDEIELATDLTHHGARVESNSTHSEQWVGDGILQRKSYEIAVGSSPL